MNKIYRKVKLTSKVKDWGLSPEAFARFKAIVGKRYNPETDELRLVSDMFEDRHTNTAYLVQLFSEIIRQSKLADKGPEYHVEDEIAKPVHPVEYFREIVKNADSEDVQANEALKKWTKLRSEGMVSIFADDTYGEKEDVEELEIVKRQRQKDAAGYFGVEEEDEVEK